MDLFLKMHLTVLSCGTGSNFSFSHWLW